MNLIQSLNNWIYTIVSAMIFVTFIEILMPDSQMKKYTKVVLGLLIMTIILNPILGFLNKDFTITGSSFKFQNELDSLYLKKQGVDYSQKQTQSVIRLYKQNLENQMEQQLKKEFNGKNIKVKVDVNNDINSETYYQITKISLTVSNGIKPVDKIGRVDISNGRQIDDNTEKVSDSYGEIKTKISSLYNISKEKIEICVDE